VAWQDGRVTSPVVDEAIKKAAVVWISIGGGPALGLWCMPLDGALFVVSGPGEQTAPGLADAERAEARLRGDTGGTIVLTEVAVERLAPGSEDWDTVAPQLANKRLNASGADSATARPDLPDASEAAAPRETPARTDVRKPFRLHRVRRPR
jgi:hypothetical protein